MDRFRRLPQGVMEQGYQVLVVGDDPDIRELITDYLATHGYRATGVDCADAMRASMRFFSNAMR